ncbi:MAG: flavodoxin, partial [Clostridia bacterium]|nr:flavodoxin [Clostridia bacterium]
MKKIITIILAAAMLFALVACGSTNGSETSGNTQNAPESTAANVDTSNTDTTSETEQTTEPAAGKKILVVYFSRTGEQYSVGNIDKGNTAIVAEMIAEKTGADLYEILPETDYYPYTYNALTDVAKKEQNEKARPKIKGDLPDISK